MKKLIANNSSFLLKPGRDQLCNEVNQWRSELEFYKMELSFFKKLLDKKFLKRIRPSDSLEIEVLLEEVKGSKIKKLNGLIKELSDYESGLLKVIEKKSASDLEEQTMITHHNLKSELNSFSVEFRSLKRRIYKVVEKNYLVTKKARAKVKSGKVAF
jgi:hypothetical protein